jgi:hypothetical protein
MIVCEVCGHILPVSIRSFEDMPDWVRSHDASYGWTWPDNENRFIVILCEFCRASCKTSLDSLLLCLPEGKQFLQAHPRIRTLPSQEIEAEGRRAILSRFESVSDNARLTVVSDYETYQLLRIDGGNR